MNEIILQTSLMDQTKNTNSKDYFTKLKILTEQIINNVQKLPKSLSSGYILATKTVENSKQISFLEKQTILKSLRHIAKKATQPQINFLNNIPIGNNLCPYPIFGIIAWNSQALEYPQINWKLCSYIEGGGVRCVPIVENNLEDQKNINSLKQSIQNINALVIPDFEDYSSLKFLQKVIDILSQYEKQFYVICFGKSSDYFLKRKLKQFQDIKQVRVGSFEGRMVPLKQSKLLQDIEINLQVRVISDVMTYTCKKYPAIDFKQFKTSQSQISVELYGIVNFKSHSQIVPMCFKQQLNSHIQVYHFYIQLWNQFCPYSTNWINKIILNFVNLIKRQYKNIKSPVKYVASYPLEFKDKEKAHYKISNKA